MNKRLLLPPLIAACSCLLVAAGCAAEEETAATPTAVSQATPTTPQPGSPTPEGTPLTVTAGDISMRGDKVETVANTTVLQVEWEDGATYVETIPDLIFRTAARPDAGRGYRTVARWLGDNRWQVTIFMRVVDRSTEPQTVLDLQAEFYYDEGKNEFTAANGRGEFALSGQNPCPSPETESEYCPLDKEIQP